MWSKTLIRKICLLIISISIHSVFLKKCGSCELIKAFDSYIHQTVMTDELSDRVNKGQAGSWRSFAHKKKYVKKLNVNIVPVYYTPVP